MYEGLRFIENFGQLKSLMEKLHELNSLTQFAKKCSGKQT